MKVYDFSKGLCEAPRATCEAVQNTCAALEENLVAQSSHVLVQAREQLQYTHFYFFLPCLLLFFTVNLHNSN